MAESTTHRGMKLVVRRELEKESYSVQEEPLFPPSPRVSWTAYRPDILGYRGEGGKEEFVIAECETHPNMKRFLAKNFSSMWFQPYLFRTGSIRRILAIPQGSLAAVDLGLRRQWEVWVLGREKPIIRIGLIGDPEQKEARDLTALLPRSR